MESLELALANCARSTTRIMELLLPNPDDAEARLHEAMRYACLGGGKRLRPFIVQESAKLFGVDSRCAARVGAAVEFIHAYSLVHDDLPAMDDSDLRRGRPSVHKEFDEATAILAGDALQALAFEVLSEPETHSEPAVRVELIAELARAAGAHGMCGGQMIDLLAETTDYDIGAITRLQRMKTGEIFSFSAISGAIMGRAGDRSRHALKNYAQEMGLAFQIADDLLDAVGNAEETGKPVGQDAEAGKATFVSILGLERARAQAQLLSEQACRHLDVFGDRADPLRAIARFVIDRAH